MNGGRAAVCVVLDVSAVPAHPAGAGVYAIALASGLAAHADVDLHLATRAGDARRWQILAPGSTVHADAPDSRPARMAWEQTHAPALARRVGADVWHGPHYTMPLRRTVSTVITVHDLTFFDHPEWHERSKVAYFRWMIRSGARRADAIVCVSDFTADRLAAHARSRGPVTVVRHGVDHHRFHSNGDRDADLAALARLGISPPYVGFVGTLEPRKDVLTLVAAFAALAADHPDLQLALVGRDGWGIDPIRDAIAASGLASRVVRTGYVDDALVPAVYRRAAAIAYPSFEEGFGLTALEAMACGAPLVTTANSALAEVAAGASSTVPVHDARALEAALRELLAPGSEVAAALRRAGPQRAREYTWEESVASHVEVYRQAAEAART